MNSTENTIVLRFRNLPNIHCTGMRATWGVCFNQRHSARPVNELLGVALTTSPALAANQETPMTETKTKPTDASINAYLASRASPEQLTDCVYIVAENPEQHALLAKLGKHKLGKSCLYFKRPADLDVKVLEALIAGSVAGVKRRYPNTGDA